jgi:hypothetical protein
MINGAPIAILAFVLGHWLSTASAQTIVDSGFETGSAKIGPATRSFGQWYGDGSAYVGTTSGITPFEGSRMLQFLTTNESLSPSSDTDSQYHQDVDLSSFSASIALGNAVLSASAMFNRVQLNSQTDTEFSIVVIIHSGTLSSSSEITRVTSILYSDSDPATWEQASISNYTLPVNTTFVTVEVNAIENIHNNTSTAEFDGQFADDVTMSVNSVPEPGNLLLGATACGFLGLRRPTSKKRK